MAEGTIMVKWVSKLDQIAQWPYLLQLRLPKLCLAAVAHQPFEGYFSQLARHRSVLCFDGLLTTNHDSKVSSAAAAATAADLLSACYQRLCAIKDQSDLRHYASIRWS